jgi:thiamine monophosphate synthase
MELGVWTVNDLYSAKKMQEMGVDYITSNWIENY